MKKTFIFYIVFFITATVYAQDLDLARCYDAVLDIEDYMERVYSFDGQSYEKTISVDSYRNITVEQALEGYDLYTKCGDTRAMCALANFYLTDKYYKDLNKAKEYYSLGCKNNFGPAFNGYGCCLWEENNHKNTEESIFYFKRAAEGGFAIAYYNLQEYEEYYARTGNSDGLYQLGLQLNNEELIIQAAKAKDIDALKYLSNKEEKYKEEYQLQLYKQNQNYINKQKENFKMNQINAQRGSVYAMLKLIEYYSKVEKDEEQVAYYLKLVTDNNYVISKNILAEYGITYYE